MILLLAFILSANLDDLFRYFYHFFSAVNKCLIISLSVIRKELWIAKCLTVETLTYVCTVITDDHSHVIINYN